MTFMGVVMIKQISKVGNSSAILLDKPLMEIVGLEEGGTVEITVNSGNIVLTPTFPKAISDQKSKDILDKIVSTRYSALKRLSQ